MFLHAFTTWLVANLLHPVMLLVALIVTGEDTGDIFNAESFAMMILVVFYSAFFSVPCLFLGWGLLHIIVTSANIVTVKFIAWVFTAALLIFLEVWVILLLLNDGQELELLLFSLPAIAATWTAIGIRWKQFRNLIYQQEVNDEENNPVKTAG